MPGLKQADSNFAGTTESPLLPVVPDDATHSLSLWPLPHTNSKVSKRLRSETDQGLASQKFVGSCVFIDFTPVTNSIFHENLGLCIAMPFSFQKLSGVLFSFQNTIAEAQSTKSTFQYKFD